MSFKFRPVARNHDLDCKCSSDFDGCAIRKFIERLERFQEQIK